MGKVSQFFKDRYVVSPRDHVVEDYQNSDFGRTYGWWVLVDGKRVASLEYRSFLEEPVHLYRVHALDPSFSKIDQDPEKWASHDVVIESRYAEDYLKKGLEMAPVGKGMIVVQKLYVPESYFKRQHDKVERFHDELLGNAEKSRSMGEDEEEAESSDPAMPDLSAEKQTQVGGVVLGRGENSEDSAEQLDEAHQKLLEKKDRAEKKQKEREQRRLELERVKDEKREQKRLEKEKAEAERLELERIQLEKQAQEKAESEQQERIEAERLEQLRMEQERLEQEHRAQVLLEQEAEALRIAREQQAAEQARRLAEAAVPPVTPSVLDPPVVPKSMPLPPMNPPNNTITQEPWQSKLGGTPRQVHPPQNISKENEGDSIAEF